MTSEICEYVLFPESPPGTRLRKWSCGESHGFVFVWHHADGEKPYWELPQAKEITDGEWSYGGRSEHLVNCHLQEVPENGADTGHLMAVHEPSMFWGKTFFNWTRASILGFLFGMHEWNAVWSHDEEEKHVARITINQKFTLFGLPLISLQLSVRQVGPSLVLLRFYCPEAKMNGVYVQAVMSVASNKQRIIHHLYTKQNLKGRLMSRLMLFGEANMVS